MIDVLCQPGSGERAKGDFIIDWILMRTPIQNGTRGRLERGEGEGGGARKSGVNSQLFFDDPSNYR